jgi:tripartite-type tricarboxylate transporter receptor subunit TctC
MSLRRALVAVTTALAVLVAIAVSPAVAQSTAFPNRNIKIVVPFAAGGGVDTLARLLAERMQAKLGVNVIVENRAGASGTLGGQSVQQSTPDGYTVLFSSNTHSMTKQVMAKPPYDPVTDFVSIARVGEAPLLTVMSTKMPQRTLAEVAAAAKANPDQWTAGTPALGSPGHLATIEFMRLTGTKLTVTPYRGTAPALTDVAGGHIQLLTDAMVVLLPMARDGKVKGMAITSSKRSSLAPDIPTTAESGVPGLEVKSWYGVWGPLGIPADVVASLNRAFTDATRELAESGRLTELGVEPIYETPEAFAKFMAKDVARNAELLASVGFQPQ